MNEPNQEELVSKDSDLNLTYIAALEKNGSRELKKIDQNTTPTTIQDCDGYVVQEGGCNYYEIEELISVPPYCNFVKANYTLRVCYDTHSGSPTIAVITDFTIELQEGINELGCDEFIEYLNSLPFREKTELFELIEYQAGLIVELGIVQDFGLVLLDGSLQVNFYRDLCYQWFTTVSDDGNSQQLDIAKFLCGTQCCKRGTTYEVVHGDTSIPSEPIFETIGDCDSDGPYGNTCVNECGPIN